MIEWADGHRLHLLNVDEERRQELADGAHQLCPYSNATRGNIGVTVTVID